MATKAYYPRTEIGPDKVGFAKTRSIIEAAFYGNNVVKVNTLREAYELAKNSPGTVVTDMPVYRGEEFGLEADAYLLLHRISFCYFFVNIFLPFSVKKFPASGFLTERLREAVQPTS